MSSEADADLSLLEDSQVDEDLINIARSIIKKVYGEQAQLLFDYLVKNEYIAEEKISNSVEVRSNEARKILQKLSDEVIVIPDKIREGGEVLHVWRLNKPALKTFIITRLKKARENLEILLKREIENTIYECAVCKRRFIVDEAYANGFQCPFDAELLVEVNDPSVINMLKSAIKRIDILISKIERVKGA